MLTRLQFKNWRSLRDVTIDNLTPITIFIGANSSGKTNILDALYFMRYATEKGIREATYAWRGRQKIRTFGVDEDVQVDFDFDLDGKQEKKSVSLFDVLEETGTEMNLLLYYTKDETQKKLLDSIIVNRWQLLRENFSPPLTVAPEADPGDFYTIDPLARNVPSMLNFMHQEHPTIYQELESDLRLLLSHVSTLKTERNDQETRFSINEIALQGSEAPSVSAGTSRLVAMLTAYYALDMRTPEQPGLVVIEEPDTAVHPLLLGKLVDLMRMYTERDEPRQFILTTHNPEMLNYFRPEEVRVVERDEETGETWVEQVPEHLKETWLNKHTLGEAWLSRIIGGIPE